MLLQNGFEGKCFENQHLLSPLNLWKILISYYRAILFVHFSIAISFCNSLSFLIYASNSALLDAFCLLYDKLYLNGFRFETIEAYELAEITVIDIFDRPTEPYDSWGGKINSNKLSILTLVIIDDRMVHRQIFLRFSLIYQTTTIIMKEIGTTARCF